MAKSDYSKDLFKQVQELMLKCDNLSSEVKTVEKRTEKKFKKQLKEQKEYFTIQWNIDTLDWKSHNSTKIVSRIMNKVSDGDIVLMHDIYSATVKAVDILIPKLINEGYQIVSVSELFYYKNVRSIVFSVFNVLQIDGSEHRRFHKFPKRKTNRLTKQG